MMFGKKTLIDEITERAIAINKQSRRTLVFADTTDTVLLACEEIIRKNIAKPLILGEKKDILRSLRRLRLSSITDHHILDYRDEENKAQLTDFAKEYQEMRSRDGKQINAEEALAKITQPHYYGAMLVHRELADGMITGMTSETKPYFPVFEIIKTRDDVKRVSGLFIMSRDDKTFFFADCAINIDPNPEQLAEIALVTAETVINFGVKPKIAMLSFSTRDSAKHAFVDKVKAATKIVKEKNSGLVIDGEIQLDAAIIPAIAEKKCAGSPLAGEANVLIFPDLDAGNIGYKLVERLGGFKAIGPIMQGTRKPINDVSRGCSTRGIVDLAAITVLQGLQ